MQKIHLLFSRSVRGTTLLLLLLCVVPVLSSCASKSFKDNNGLEKVLWTKFHNQYTSPPAEGGYYISFSLYLSYKNNGKKKGNRTLVTLWGNNNGETRLDLTAGVGTLLASLREEENGLVAYYPEEKQAFYHQNAEAGLKCLGFPIPMALSDLAMLLYGSFDTFVPAEYQEATLLTENQVGYVPVPNHRGITYIVLDSEGKPIKLEGRSADGRNNEQSDWRIVLEKYSGRENTSGPQTAGKVTLSFTGTRDDATGVLRVKALEDRPLWQEKSLELTLPEDTERVSLDAERRAEFDMQRAQ
ncbi:MAG: hypothetical protein ACNI27_00475 [Desulfovibrio sp.]